MKQRLLHFLKILIPFSILLFGIQYYLVSFVLQKDFYYSTLAIYAFHFFSTLLIYLFLVYVHNSFRDKTGFAFMACSLLKMMAAVLFLLPVMLSDSADPLGEIFAFFIPYFLYLIFETIHAVKLINIK